VEFETSLSTGASVIPIQRAWNERESDLRHGFIGRIGGVSAGDFASMNLSYFVGDEPRAVDANGQGGELDDVLKTLLGRDPITVDQFLRETAQSFK